MVKKVVVVAFFAKKLLVTVAFSNTELDAYKNELEAFKAYRSVIVEEAKVEVPAVRVEKSP